MERIERLTVEEYLEFEGLLEEEGLQDYSGEVLEKLPSHLFGIAIDYGFNETEVRDWIFINAQKIADEIKQEENRETLVDPNVFVKCEWCAGTGHDVERFAIGAIEKCWDCQGTGLEGGLKAQEVKFSYERKMTELIEKEIDWDEVERIEKEYENKRKNTSLDTL